MNNLAKNLKQNPFAMIIGVIAGAMLVNIYIWARDGNTISMLFTLSILLTALKPLVLKLNGSKKCNMPKK